MKCYWLMNHECTVLQFAELQSRFRVDEVIYPSEELSGFWKNLPCTPMLDTRLLNQWVDSVSCDDIAVVQGDSTYSLHVVNALMDKGVHVYAAVSERVVAEQKESDGSVRIVRVFNHKLFREYSRP